MLAGVHIFGLVGVLGLDAFCFAGIDCRRREFRSVLHHHRIEVRFARFAVQVGAKSFLPGPCELQAFFNEMSTSDKQVIEQRCGDLLSN